MKIVKSKIGFLFLLGILAVVIGASYKPVSAVSTYACLPTCSESDAHFLALAGSGLSTFAGDTVAIELAAPAGAASVDIEIFDGDTSGTWDSGTTASMYELFADPTADGTGITSVGSWSGNLMPNNGWYSISVPTSGAAEAPSGNFFYTLRVSNSAPGAVSLNSFKVRTSAGVVTMKPQAFAFVSPAITMADIFIVYPSWPSLSPTTYDGTWDFHLAAVPSTGEFVAWDGDLDFGSYDYSAMDTDDADTPNAVPPWGVGTEAVPEGVASGYNGTTGAPSDDSGFAPYRRSPSVVYSIEGPNGNVYSNGNPSGNQEWEQFLITDDAGKDADYYVGAPMPSGVYHVQMAGMDMTNLNAWRFDYDLLCVTDTGEVCDQLFPYLLGDTVFYDTNGNGVQDLGESGIGGVTVNLVDEFGTVLATTTTNGSGYYDFGVYPGTYTVQVDGSNFGSGAPLEGLNSTTGGETQTNTVVDANVMTYDFGYRADPTNPGTGTPGYWKNHPEAWPVDGLFIGDQFFTKEQAIDIMNAKGGGDMRFVMFNQLVAAKLNVLIGNDDSCVADAIAAADQWFIDVGLDLNTTIKTDSDDWDIGEPILETLDAYNNGLLCAPSRG